MSDELEEILAEVRQRKGTDLTGYRRNMLQRRIAARMAQLGIGDLASHLHRLRDEPAECDRLVEAISIGVSSFFRDPPMWCALEHSVLGSLLKRHRNQQSQEIRIWSAGCATGEEPYSVAILIHQMLKQNTAGMLIHIFGTDLSEHALKSAATGVYPRAKLETTQLGLIDRYFIARDGEYEIRPGIRQMVWFSQDDLCSTARFAPAGSVYGTFDLVLCRNVVIYFDAPLQEQILQKLTKALAPGGHLVLGESEGVRQCGRHGLTPICGRHRIYQRMSPSLPEEEAPR